MDCLRKIRAGFVPPKAKGVLFVGVLAVRLLASPPSVHAAGPIAIAKGPWVQRVTFDSAIVRVEVDPPSPATLEVGLGLPDGQGGHRIIESAESRSIHTIEVKGLEPATRYAYSVRAGAASKYAAFVTAPPDDGDAPFRFLVYGDNRSDDAAHAAIVRAMVPVASDFLVHTGDLVEDGAVPAHWQTFFDIEAPLLSTRCFLACVGNHELTDGGAIEYARYFGWTDLPLTAFGARSRHSRSGLTSEAGVPTAMRPEHLNGTFRWGNTRFFLINGMVSYQRTVDRFWLEKALSDADDEKNLEWRVVVVHHGPWSSGPHGNNARLHEAGVVPLLTRHKVDLVISGHDHLYERGWSEGLAYVVSGGGGAPVYRIKSQLPQARRVESVRHFVDVSVSARSMRFVATRVDGSTIERCSLHKGALGWDCDSPVVGVGSTGLAPRPAPASASRCGCVAVGADVRSGLAASFGVAAGGVFVWRRRRLRRG